MVLCGLTVVGGGGKPTRQVFEWYNAPSLAMELFAMRNGKVGRMAILAHNP